MKQMIAALLALLLAVSTAFAQQVSVSPPSLPLAVGQGGTGDAGTAWTAYTPTVTCTSGSLTTSSAAGRWKAIGKTVWLQISIAITTVGTCANNLSFTLPNSFTVNVTGVSYLGTAYDNTATATPILVIANGSAALITFSSAPAAHTYYGTVTFEAS